MLKGILLFVTEHILKGGALRSKRWWIDNWHGDCEILKILNAHFLLSRDILYVLCKVPPSVFGFFALVVYDSSVGPLSFNILSIVLCHLSSPASVEMYTLYCLPLLATASYVQTWQAWDRYQYSDFFKFQNTCQILCPEVPPHFGEGSSFPFLCPSSSIQHTDNSLQTFIYLLPFSSIFP